MLVCAKEVAGKRLERDKVSPHRRHTPRHQLRHLPLFFLQSCGCRWRTLQNEKRSQSGRMGWGWKEDMWPGGWQGRRHGEGGKIWSTLTELTETKRGTQAKIQTGEEGEMMGDG